MPDLIISDLMMPGIDGIELLRELKNNIHTNHIPVIILTAKTSDTERVEGLQAGADDYITKPFNFDVLELKIKNLLEGRKALKEKYMRRVVIEGSEIEIENEDEKFLKKALNIVEANLQDPEFSVEVFSLEIGLSRVHLYRKLHALIDEYLKFAMRWDLKILFTSQNASRKHLRSLHLNTRKAIRFNQLFPDHS
jgi:DNA-binding response OmpR family regulator